MTDRETTRAAYRFELPPGAIAQTPADRRDEARLLVLPRRTGAPRHRSIADLPAELAPGDLLVLNDTRVLPARVLLRRASGGTVPALLLESPVGERFRAMLVGRGKLRVGDVLTGPEGVEVELERAEGEGVWTLRAVGRPDVGAVLLAHGRMPLPPYIRREKERDARDALDRERYQTVFAAREGAVAAPTAGLHFTEPLLAELASRGVETATVTLQIGRAHV